MDARCAEQVISSRLVSGFGMVTLGGNGSRRPCLYLMGLNLSNQQIAEELGLCAADVQQSTIRPIITNTVDPGTLVHMKGS